MSATENKKLSIVIPTYKQEKTIVSDIKNIVSVLDKISYPYEVIVVIDGRIDKTFEKLKKAKIPKVKIIGYKKNHGKGYAVRYGIARSTGNIVGFIDAGSDLNPRGLRMLLAHFEWYRADIIVGSKWHPVSIVSYPFWRRILSQGYGFYVKLLFGLRVEDTQLGMKFFKREVLEKVMPRLLIKKFAMDIEILAVANRLGFKRIFEAPIELSWKDGGSKLEKKLVNTIWNMFWDTMAVYYRLKILGYYDDGDKK